MIKRVLMLGLDEFWVDDEGHLCWDNNGDPIALVTKMDLEEFVQFLQEEVNASA